MSCSLGDILVPTPIASVIIPAYNGAKYLGEAIRSVLDQTYQDFELIVVDDASRDETALVIQAFDDPRLKYIAHQENAGACSARKTGLQASVGEIIFFLDQDDLFHPEKLAAHVAYHVTHPEIGFTYNAFFQLNPSSATVREVTNPANPVTLADLVLGFPIPPSAWVLKRQWALLDEIWDESTFLHGREYVFCGRLNMAGCAYAKVDGVLHYRRHHAGRKFRNLKTKCEAELTCQNIIFTDARCPESVIAIRDVALSRTYLSWANLALKQEETPLGQELLREAVRLRPELLVGDPPYLPVYFLSCSLDDDRDDHAVLLRRIHAQLPPEMAHLGQYYDWTARQGYLLKGARAVMWGRPDDGVRFFEAARHANAWLDKPTMSMITAWLLDYAAAFGFDTAAEVADDLFSSLTLAGGARATRYMKGLFFFNCALEKYRAGKYVEVPRDLITAVKSDPKYLANRGAMSILSHSTAHLINRSYKQIFNE
jgi:glycosyltransferase involved in cell wall biosynthesis